ncbi:MAG: protoporphyrinogen IX oxidase [Cytophagales bacterium]|nr:MAG: protoporphyrinogen IX oxidase [Cytophagales bacterium]
MSYLYLKSLHIIFVVTWFAGLFYIVRLFIYNTEANQYDEPKKSILQQQYLVMQTRLWYGITWPSAIITSIWGGSLAWHYSIIPSWLWIKFFLIFLLYAYHFLCHHIYIKQQKGIFEQNSFQLRVWNEVATIFLVGIVFIVVLKDFISMLWGIFGLIVFSIVLLASIFIYKKIREKNTTQ